MLKTLEPPCAKIIHGISQFVLFTHFWSYFAFVRFVTYKNRYNSPVVIQFSFTHSEIDIVTNKCLHKRVYNTFLFTWEVNSNSHYAYTQSDSAPRIYTRKEKNTFWNITISFKYHLFLSQRNELQGLVKPGLRPSVRLSIIFTQWNWHSDK